MKNDETVKEYTDRLVRIVSQIRLHGEELSERRVVEKELVSVLERFEPKIPSLEDSRSF